MDARAKIIDDIVRNSDSDWAAVAKAYDAGMAAERERINELLREHQGVSLETLEYLETMRQGPTAEEWADLDRNARA